MQKNARSGKAGIIKMLFVFFFFIPVSAVGFYLFTLSKDQYKTDLSFSVRSETPANPIDFFSTGSSSPDSEILVDFIYSREMLDAVNTRLNLFKVYNEGDYDPLYQLKEDAQVEDLMQLWERMINVFHDRATGIIQVEVFAFDPESSLIIAQEIIKNCHDLINRVSNISENDKLTHVKGELDTAFQELQAAQLELTQFRSRFRVVDPDADFRTHIELVKSLQEKYIDYTIEFELMSDILADDDVRINQAKKKVSTLRDNIELEKLKISSKDPNENEDLVFIFDKYDKLSINMELAKELYSESRRSYSATLSETKIKNKYLAAHVEPRIAESSKFPQRYLIFSVTVILCLLLWFSSSLVYYSIRDRS